VVEEETVASSSASGQAGKSIWSEVLLAFVPVVGLFIGGVLAWYTSTWAAHAFRDAFDVAELSPVPVHDRAPGVPGPTLGYWLSWVFPLVTVYSVSALLLWRWRRGRLLTGTVIAGLSAVVLFFVPIAMSIEVGGFAPE